MESVNIKADGALIKNKKPVTGQTMKLLGHSVGFDPDVTLGSMFKMFEKYPDFFALSDMLPPLSQVAAEAYAPGLKSDEIDHLVFYKTVEITGFPGKPGLTFYNSLKGVLKATHIDLKFFHIETLMDHHLKLGDWNISFSGTGRTNFFMKPSIPCLS
jgi:hypothetical protein